MSSLSNIAVSGLNNASLRLATAAKNIVNASSTAVLPSGGQNYSGYQPQDVVSISDGAQGVTSALTQRTPAYTTASDPTSSNANSNGLVAIPNVDTASELVTSKQAQISYSADAKLIKVNEELEKTLLDAVT